MFSKVDFSFFLWTGTTLAFYHSLFAIYDFNVIFYIIIYMLQSLTIHDFNKISYIVIYMFQSLTIHDFNIISYMVIYMLQNLIIRTLVVYVPSWDLFRSKLWIIFKTSSLENVVNARNWSVWVTKSFGSLLLFCIIE